MTAIFDHPATPGHAAPRRGIVPLSLLWFGLFGGPAAWATQTIANYALVSHYCWPNDVPLAQPTFGGVRAIAIVVSIVCIATTVAALFTAIHSWQATREGHGGEHRHVAEVGEGRARFMGLAGILVSGIFIYAVVMNALPLVTLPICSI